MIGFPVSSGTENGARAFSFLITRSDFLTVAVVPALLATPSTALGDLASSAPVTARPSHGDDVLGGSWWLILLSPVEVINSIVERIQARNPSLNAFVYFGFASPSRSTATPEPVFDRVLSDVLLLVRFSAQILEPGSRRDPRVVAHRKGGARESKPLEIRGVIDQAKKELDAKSRISFKAEPFKTGRKIQGWKIQSDRQQAKKRRTKGAVSLPEAA
jgi:hypothetical protein